MKRIELILDHLKKQLAKYPDDLFWVDTYSNQIKFFTWLLSESDKMPDFELHQPKVERTVWGIGDVSYHLRIQLLKLELDSPVAFIIDYEDEK